MYAYHLTIDVKDSGHEAYRVYKREAADVRTGIAGQRWTVMLHDVKLTPNLYYQIAFWDSEEALQTTASSPEMRAVVEKHQPYTHMNSSPAFREVVDVLEDEQPAGGAPRAPKWCRHTTFLLADADHATGLTVALGEQAATTAEPSSRRLLLQVKAQPSKLYQLTLCAGEALARQSAPKLPRGLLSEPPTRRLCEVLWGTEANPAP